MWVRSLGQEDPLEEDMAAHSSILAWRIPRTEEPGRLKSMGSQRLGHDGSDGAQRTAKQEGLVFSEGPGCAGSNSNSKHLTLNPTQGGEMLTPGGDQSQRPLAQEDYKFV